MKSAILALTLAASTMAHAQVYREPIEVFEVDLRLETSQQIRNGLYGAVLAASALDMNNNGNDALSRSVFVGALAVVVVDNLVTIKRRRNNLKKSLVERI